MGSERMAAGVLSRSKEAMCTGSATSQSLFAEVKRIVVRGLENDFDVFASTVDYKREDQTLLLPI